MHCIPSSASTPSCSCNCCALFRAPPLFVRFGGGRALSGTGCNFGVGIWTGVGSRALADTAGCSDAVDAERVRFVERTERLKSETRG
jgi:hypothetical protein